MLIAYLVASNVTNNLTVLLPVYVVLPSFDSLGYLFLLRESFSWPNVAFWCSMFVHAAGQERFRTLTSSYYRGAQGIVMGISPFIHDIYNRLVNSCYNAIPHCKVLKMVFLEFKISIVLGHLLCLNCIWWLTCKMCNLPLLVT